MAVLIKLDEELTWLGDPGRLCELGLSHLLQLARYAHRVAGRQFDP